MEEEEGVGRGTSREAEFWAESTACAKARGQETASYISVGDLPAVWSSWSMEQSARDLLGQPCRNGRGRFLQSKMATSFVFLWVRGQCNCFPPKGIKQDSTDCSGECMSSCCLSV